jgi:hypothetical protein
MAAYFTMATARLRQSLSSGEPRVFRAIRELDGPWGTWGRVSNRVSDLGSPRATALSLLRFFAAEPTLNRAHVRVELGGRDYIDPATEVRDDVPFALAAAAVCDACAGEGQASVGRSAPLYIAQSQIPPALDALCAGLAPVLRGRDNYGRNVWIGPVGTVTPLHRDPNRNMLAQVVGAKRVRLYRPDSHVYPITDRPHMNASAVDAEAPGPEFPLFPTKPDALVEIGPGDALLIPEGWWHHVRCIAGPSFSLNYWFR